MKALLIGLLLLLSCGARAQQVPFTFSPLPLEANTRRVVYTAVVPVEQASADQLFTRAQQWLTQAVLVYKASSPLLRPETRTLQLRGTLKHGQESLGFRLRLVVEEGRYRYRLDHITYAQPATAREGKHSRDPVISDIETLVYTRPRKSRDKQLAVIDARLKSIFSNLNSAMQGSPAGLATQW